MRSGHRQVNATSRVTSARQRSATNAVERARYCPHRSLDSFLWRARALLCAVVLALAAPMAAAQVLVVLSDEADVYREIANDLKRSLAPLREGRLTLDVVSAASAANVRAGHRYELIVTVGVPAAQAVVGTTSPGDAPPVLCLLVSRHAFEALQSRGGTADTQRISAVYVEQPIARQLDLIQLALPGTTRIGTLFGPTSAALAHDLQERARERGFTVNRIDVADAGDVYNALQKVLPGSDVLLALPDPVAVNASTAYGVLVTSYRSQVPVVGFSRALSDAGALLAVYSTAQQQGRQGAEIAARVLTGDAALPPPQYPRYFTVAVNFFAARALGLAMENESTLAEQLAARGRSRSDVDAPSPRDRRSAAQHKGP
jgi:ABC-type uncharacterized transport system substrate-binding protein